MFSAYDKAKIPALITLVQLSVGNISQSSRARKLNKKHTDQKEIKLSLFVDDMTVCIENLKRSTKNPASTKSSAGSQDTR